MPRTQRRRRRSYGSGEESAGWLATYADMITLVLAFFILLFSFSIIDVERFREVIESIQLTFLGHTGIMERTPEAVVDRDRVERAFIDEVEMRLTREDVLEAEQVAMLHRMERVQEVYKEVKAFLQEANLTDEVTVRLEPRGVIMEMPDRIFFLSGKADLQEESMQVLDKLAELFLIQPYDIIVEGHTDNVPISTFLFPSNWELSVTRAVRVTRYLVEEVGLSPYRFVATGHGEHYPVATNETPEGRAQNRRVSFVIAVE